MVSLYQLVSSSDSVGTIYHKYILVNQYFVKMDDPNDIFETKNVLEFYISSVLENLSLGMY